MMAMQQQDPRQMQQAPMAQYGMSMGGYDMPFYDDPYEMAYGGMPKYVTGGPGDTTPKRKNTTKKQSETDYKKLYNVDIDDNKSKVTDYDDLQTKSTKGYGNADENLENFSKFKDVYPNYADLEKDINKVGGPGKKNAKVMAFQTWYNNEYLSGQGKKINEQRIAAGEKPLDEAQLKSFNDSLISDYGFSDKKGRGIDGDLGTYTTSRDLLKYSAPEPKPVDEVKPEPEPETEPETVEETVEKTVEEPKTVKEVEKVAPAERKPAKWWLQDNVNTMGAVSDLASVKKYMPWEARVDLEEPRPTFLDPTRELAAQSEQANIASQASASFAGPQGLAARNSATQGNAAAQAANTLGNINNQNVNIANQFEGTQTGIRNQESMLNQQMANRVYDKNTIANQQFDNAKLAGRQNLRNAYNTGVTNKWKTDALNQMYPNYQTDAGPGGKVTYTPTDKTLDTTKKETAYNAAKTECQGQNLTGEALTKCIDSYIKIHSKYGGESFEYGGYVYTVYPNY